MEICNAYLRFVGNKSDAVVYRPNGFDLYDGERTSGGVQRRVKVLEMSNGTFDMTTPSAIMNILGRYPFT